MIAFVPKAADGSGTAVLVFHGVGADCLRVPDADHQALVNCLPAHRDEVRMTTLQARSAGPRPSPANSDSARACATALPAEATLVAARRLLG